MMYQVSDDGHATVAWELSPSQTATAPQVQDFVKSYLGRVTTDLASAGVTLISDSYRVRADVKTRRPQKVFWTAQVPPEQADQLRAYLSILASSLAGA